MLQDLYSTFVAFEAQAQKFDTALLLGSGIGLLLVGLTIWLAGLAFSRAISAIIAAVVASLAAFTLTGGKASAAILGAAAGLICGAILRRPIFALAAALLAASCTIVVVSQKTEFAPTASLSVPSADAPVLSAADSWERIRTSAKDVYSNILASGTKQPHSVYFAAAIAAVIAFLVTIVLGNLGAALGCSATGTVMALLGLITLLCYKGAQPVEFINGQPMLSAGIFGGMVAFGVLVQLILMKPRKGIQIVVAPPMKMDEAAPVDDPKATAISLKPDQS
jgi:hypothetical protein